MLRKSLACILLLLTITLLQGPAEATTYNCFEVDKRASFGINGGIVNVNGDQMQKTCKFSVDNATVDSIAGAGSGLNALLKQPEALAGLKRWRLRAISYRDAGVPSLIRPTRG